MEVESTWFCVRSKPKHEKISASHLEVMLGLVTVCPMFSRRQRTKVGWKVFVEALFPGYFFVQAAENRLRAIAACPGVSGVVSFGGKPAVVAGAVITEILQAVAEYQPDETGISLTLGQEIAIRFGPFGGMEGRLVSVVPARERVVILLEILGRKTVAEVPIYDLDPIRIHPVAVN